MRADDSADVHTVIGDVAEALSGGQASDAMSGFSKKCPAYEKLSSYFEALTNAYEVQNRIEFQDEEVSATAAAVAVRWDLTLTIPKGEVSKNRSAEVTVKLVREKKRWLITEFTPIDIFDPQGQ